MIQAVKPESVDVYDFKQAFGLTEQEVQGFSFPSFQKQHRYSFLASYNYSRGINVGQVLILEE